ncbi:hypothetical protein GLOIN_2v1883388 [Rhizophagus clarus]|uniref:Hsp70 family protein n=1 Tax=Rhizophagus clarus TaxID=94130 RepID=A0A8H3MC49_9GLOM|nr:hypothetical protein GLOIN_2v1883388 [Rhizophagus clarus]
MNDCRVVVGIELGTTHSGFGYAQISSTEDISFHTEWDGRSGTVKVPTVLSYDDEYNKVLSWGFPALEGKHIELFKLLLGKIVTQPPLPCEKAIIAYLRRFGKIVKETICKRWESIKFHNHVLIILTIPDDYKISIWTMRECAFKAGLLNYRYSQNLIVITESEAIAFFCMKHLKEHNLSVGEKFMVVKYENLSVILEEIENNFGGNLLDQEIIRFLEEQVGESTISLLKECQPQQLQYLQNVIKYFLMNFTGIRSEFNRFEFELEEYCPSLAEYCEGKYRNRMVRNNWILELSYLDAKALLDPVIETIMQLIDSCNNDCLPLSLVGKFAESQYLRSRIEEEFSTRVHIPPSPEAAIMKGAILYGKNYVNISDDGDIIENIQGHLSQTIIKFEEEKKKLQDENKLYNDLQEKHNDLTNKYGNLNDEFMKLEAQIKDIRLQGQREIQTTTDDLNKYKSLCENLQIKFDDANKYKLLYENSQMKYNYNYKSLYEKLQVKYDDATNKYNEEKNQHQKIVEDLESNIKEIEDKYLKNIQQLENQINEINQQHQNKIKLQEERENQIQNKLQDEIQASNNDLNNYKSLYDNLQKNYNDVMNKYNQEKNQHQIIVENMKINIEDKYLKDIQQLENQIIDNDQHHQTKIKLQEQQINQLQQSIELKETKLQSLEKEKDKLSVKNQNNTNLINQLVSSQSDDADQNQKNLNNDISELNKNLKKYITDLDRDVIVNMEGVRKLLLLYKCQTRITSQKDDLLLIQAVLQRHVIETIFSDATKYFQNTGQSGQDYLESDIINKASLLSTSLANASKYRTGNDEITRVASTKFRKQICLILDNCGFTDVKSNTICEHPFITFCKEKLNNIMNDLRIIKDQEKIAVENLAATIIREIIKIFWFRLKVYESFVVQYVWIPYNAKVDGKFMEGENFADVDNENLYVDLCYFPLIGRDLTSNNHKVYAPAKVFIRKNQQQIQ